MTSSQMSTFPGCAGEDGGIESCDSKTGVDNFVVKDKGSHGMEGSLCLEWVGLVGTAGLGGLVPPLCSVWPSYLIFFFVLLYHSVFLFTWRGALASGAWVFSAAEGWQRLGRHCQCVRLKAKGIGVDCWENVLDSTFFFVGSGLQGTGVCFFY